MKSIFYYFLWLRIECLAGFVKEKWRPLRKEKCVYFIILFRFRPNYAIQQPCTPSAFEFQI